MKVVVKWGDNLMCFFRQIYYISWKYMVYQQKNFLRLSRLYSVRNVFLKSVNFKNTVARSSFLSKLWSFSIHTTSADIKTLVTI